jgi:hypothetical protein
MMRNLYRLNASLGAYTTACLTICIMAACSTLSVKTDFDPAADFTALHTYNWFPNAPSAGEASGDPLYNNSLLDQRVRRGAEAAMLEKGFKKVQKLDAPDFYVQTRMRIQERVTSSGADLGLAYGGGYGYGPFAGYAGPGLMVSQYTEGTLILDFIEPLRKVLLWRGYATNAFDSPEVSEEKLQNVVKEILKKFPPEKASKR